MQVYTWNISYLICKVPAESATQSNLPLFHNAVPDSTTPVDVSARSLNENQKNTPN